MEREKVVDAFIKRIAARAYLRAESIIIRMLEQGPIEANPSIEKTQIHEWYRQLGLDQQDQIKQIVRETAFSAVFGCLVVLDNSTTEYVLENEISDIALYVQRYADAESYSSHKIADSIQINDLMDLHEVFREQIDRG